MKSLMKLTIAAAAAASLATLASAPASAQVHIGVGIPGVHIGVVGAPCPPIITAPAIIRPARATPITITIAAIAAMRFTTARSCWMASPWAARIIIAGSTTSPLSGIAAAGISGMAGAREFRLGSRRRLWLAWRPLGSWLGRRS